MKAFSVIHGRVSIKGYNLINQNEEHPSTQHENLTKLNKTHILEKNKNMGQSLVQNYIHFVFSTKNLDPLIKPAFEVELYKYLGGVCKNNDSPSLKIGGHMNHVHVLCRLSKKIALIDFIQLLKSRSSKWMKTKDTQLSNFYWQDGYGAFSVSPGHVDNLVRYIANQHEHHKQISFKEEYVSLLRKYNVDFNTEYLW